MKKIAQLTTALLLMALLTACAAYNTYQGKSKQSEAPSQLSSLCTCQIAYYGENGCYGKSFEDVGFEVDGNNQYAYFLGDDVIQPAVGGPYTLPEGIETYVNEEGFQIVAVANLDSDPDLDIWVANQYKEFKNVASDLDGPAASNNSDLDGSFASINMPRKPSLPR